LYNVEDKEKFNYEKLNIPIPDDLIDQLEQSTLLIADKFKLHTNNQKITINKRELKILQAIKTLARDNSVILINTDKNLGPALVYTQWYNESMIETLSVTTNYKPLNCDTNPSIYIKKIRTELYNILKAHKINEGHPVYKFILQPYNNFFCKPYALPKVHKNTTKLKIRMICPATKYITYAASRFVHIFLNETMSSCIYSINSNTALLQKLSQQLVHTDDLLVSFDVVELYPSISPHRALDAINAHLLHDNIINNNRFKDYRYLILQLLQVILFNNYLQFTNIPTNDNPKHSTFYFLQILGIAMGTPCAVTVANIFLHKIETQTLHQMTHPPTLYCRYIDDIYAIIPSTQYKDTFIQHFNAQDENIKITCEHNHHTIDYLDITSYKPSNIQFFERLHTTMFYKKTNRFLYMHPLTHLPNHIRKNVITSSIQRIRKICSSPIQYMYHLDLLYKRLIKRHHNPKQLNIYFNTPTPTRNHLLYHKKIKTSVSSAIITVPYHPFTIQHKSFIKESLTLPPPLIVKYPQLHSEPPIVAFNNNSSILQLYKKQIPIKSKDINNNN